KILLFLFLVSWYLIFSVICGFFLFPFVPSCLSSSVIRGSRMCSSSIGRSIAGGKGFFGCLLDNVVAGRGSRVLALHGTDRQILPNPLDGLIPLALLEIAYFGGGEGFAEDRHSGLPFAITHQGHALDIGKVLDIELDVFPQRS